MVKWENNKRIFEEINFFFHDMLFYFYFFFRELSHALCLVLKNIKKRKINTKEI